MRKTPPAMTNATIEPGKEGSGPPGAVDTWDSVSIALPEKRLFTPDFVLVSFAAFANSLGMQMLIATLPVYVISLGGSQSQAGLVSGALAFTALLFRPIIGWLTDAWRRRPLILIGTSCYGFASVFYLLADSIPLLLFGRLVHGFGLCCYTTAANAYVADIAPFRRRAEAVGIFTAAQTMGLIIGPLVGFMIIGALGFHSLFYFSAGLAFAAFIISFFTKEARPAGEIKRQPWTPRTGIVAVDALPMAWMTLCMGMGMGTISAFIAIFAKSRGIQNPGFYFMVQAIALLVSRVFAGHLADKYGRAATIFPGIIVAAAALSLLPWVHGIVLFAVSASLFGLGFGAAQPATMALLIDRIKPEQRGLATGTYYTGFDAGIAMGSIFLGMVSEIWGFGVMWPISAACTLLGLTGLLPGRRRGRSINK